MNPSTFRYLCNEVSTTLKRRSTDMRDPISVERRVAMTLWRLATNSDYRTIGHLFGVAKCTACVIVNEVCEVIMKQLFKRYVFIPQGNDLNQVVEGFEDRWGFPQCVGAIDGSHIPIQAPADCPKDYYNRKGFHSILMQGLVDHRYCFMDINVGWPGSVHDARVLANSELFQKGESGTLFPQRPKKINNVMVPLVIVGDPAYPLLPWMMKPYTDTGRLSRQQSSFNYRLSRARVVTENAFGRLKGRWRCLLKRNDTNISMMPTIVAVCTILHNMCEIHGDEFDQQWLSVVNRAPIQNLNAEQDNHASTQAEDIWLALAKYFISHRLN